MSIVEKLGDWTYETFLRDEPSATFDQFESLVRLWQSKLADGRLPARKDFVFEDFTGWHGDLAIGDVQPGGRDVRFRLWGTALVSLFGSDLTGKCMSDAETGFFESYDFDHIAEIVSNGTLMTGTGPIYWQNRDHMTVYTLKLPLSDDGNTVNRILWAVRHNRNRQAGHKPPGL